MALIKSNFYSNILKMSTSINVIIPEITRIKKSSRQTEFKDSYPVLYLLHGLSDDHNAWLRKTSIERYAEEAGLAVVMPNVGRSFYTDQKKGQNYFSFISQELPKIVNKLFPLRRGPKNTFAAGLSMGGYGAFKLALNYPERFRAAASFSGVLDIVEAVKRQQNDEEAAAEFKWIYGEEKKIKNSKNDLFYLLQKLKKEKKKIPHLYQCCGTEDFLYPDNLKFRDFALKNKINLEYKEETAAHEWWYWDKMISSFIKWLPVYKSI